LSSTFLLLLLLEPLEGLLNHLIVQPFFPEKDLLLNIGDLLNILALQEDGGYGDKLFLLLHLLQLFLLLLLPLGFCVSHYDVIISMQNNHFLLFTFLFPSAFGAFFDFGSLLFSFICDEGMNRKYPRAATMIARRGIRILGFIGSFYSKEEDSSTALFYLLFIVILLLYPAFVFSSWLYLLGFLLTFAC